MWVCECLKAKKHLHLVCFFGVFYKPPCFCMSGFGGAVTTGFGTKPAATGFAPAATGFGAPATTGFGAPATTGFGKPAGICHMTHTPRFVLGLVFVLFLVGVEKYIAFMIDRCPGDTDWLWRARDGRLWCARCYHWLWGSRDDWLWRARHHRLRRARHHRFRRSCDDRLRRPRHHRLWSPRHHRFSLLHLSI